MAKPPVPKGFTEAFEKKSIEDPYRDYEVTYSNKKGQGPKYWCHINKKHTKPYCRKGYNLFNDLCTKLGFGVVPSP